MPNHLHSSVDRVSCMRGHPNHDRASTFHGKSYVSKRAPEEPPGMKTHLTKANHVFSMAHHLHSNVDRANCMMGHLTMTSHIRAM
eukprot:12402262-Karenia_brevis.AAC.1